MNRFQALTSLVVVVLLGIPWTAEADLQAGSQTFTLFGGSANGSGRDVLTTADDDHHHGREHGHIAGAQYLYFFRSVPALGIGLDGSWSSLRDRSDHLLSGDRLRLHERATVAMPILKLTFPTGHLRPYIFGGIGAARTSGFASAQPLSGVTWTDTGTTERRTLVDDHAWQAAASAGVGLDFYFTEHVFMGLEARETALGRHRYRTTADGQALGVTLRSPSNLQNVLVRLGMKWGR